VGMADVTLTTVGHAQRAMDKKLQFATLWVKCLVDFVDLREGEFTGQHDLREAHVLQETRFFGGSDVGLRAGMELDRR